MASRARELLDRSRVLLDRSRVAAAQFLIAPPKHRGHPAARPAGPAFVELTRPEPVAAPSGEGVLAEICASVALRDLNLLDQLLARLEDLEAGEEDRHRLAELYRLDHLATRLRRNAENLRVLAGQDTADAAAHATSVLDLVREAMSSINHYARITIGRVVNLGVVGFAAEDLGRVLAELFDNAANQSSPSSPVHVSAHLTEQGSVLVRIEDEGIGMPAGRVEDLNARLAAGGDLDDAAARHMGLAVVARLAARHGVTVRLDRRSPHGTVATVLLPTGIVTEIAEHAWSGTRTVTFVPVKAAAGGEPVAAGALPLVQLFDRVPERSPYTRPMRALSLVYAHGVGPRPEHPDRPGVRFNIVPGVGELFVIPAYTLSGNCDILFFEGVPGGPLDCFDDRPGPDEHFTRLLGLVRQFVPWEYERCRDAELTDAKATLAGGYTPVVRNPVGTLPGGATVLGMADVVVANDPITGQGSNNASHCAATYLDAILAHGDRPFDAAWMAATFERYWEYARHVTEWTNALLLPPPPHVLQILGVAERNPVVARRFVNGFADPTDYRHWFMDPVLWEKYLAEV